MEVFGFIHRLKAFNSAYYSSRGVCTTIHDLHAFSNAATTCKNKEKLLNCKEETQYGKRMYGDDAASRPSLIE